MLQRLNYLITTLAILAFSPTVGAQGANPFIGTWDIDLRASNFGSAPAPTNMSRTYYDHGDESYTYMVITTNDDTTLSGTTAHYTYSGEQYPIANFNQTVAAQIAYNKINDTSVEYTVYVDKEVQQIGAKFISPNYQTLTISIQFPGTDQDNQILIFNRRS